jgi:predicted dienelactone hydrolase
MLPSSDDRIVPFASNAGYLQRYLPRIIASHNIRDALHSSFLGPCSDAVRALHPDSCSDLPGSNRAAFQNILNQSLVAFFRAERPSD